MKFDPRIIACSLRWEAYLRLESMAALHYPRRSGRPPMRECLTDLRAWGRAAGVTDSSLHRLSEDSPPDLVTLTRLAAPLGLRLDALRFVPLEATEHTPTSPQK